MKFKTKRYYKNQNETLLTENSIYYAKNERLSNEINKYKEIVREIESGLSNALKRLEMEIEKNANLSKKISSLVNDLETKEKERRKIAGKLGALTREINKIQYEKDGQRLILKSVIQDNKDLKKCKGSN